MRARGLGIFARIAGGYALVLLIMLAMGGVLLSRVNQLASGTQKFATEDFSALRSVADLTTSVYDEETSATRFFVAVPGPGRDKWLDPMYTARAAIDLDLTRLDEFAANHTYLQAPLHNIEARLQSRRVQLDFDIAAARAGRPVDMADDSVAINGIEGAANEFSSNLAAHVNSEAAVAVAAVQETLTLTAALFLVAILATILAGLVISRSISVPLVALTAAANRIADGEVIDPPNLRRRDEIGVLSSALAVMVKNLRGLAEKERGLQVDLAEHQRVQAELQRSNAELEQFAYVASHDLQEPLRMVSSYTGLLKRRYQSKLDSDADEFIAFAVEGVTRMQALINDLLAYSRVGRGDRPLQEIDAAQALGRALSNLQTAIEERAALVFQEPLPDVIANPIQLTQLFQNLIGNALKFCKDGRPEVRVTAEAQGGDWIFSVQDNGIGIDPEYRDRIFLIFQRLHKREEYPGTGIGLAVCKKIVEQHGGRIWVESQPGKGSTFKFTLRAVGGKELAA